MNIRDGTDFLDQFIGRSSAEADKEPPCALSVGFDRTKDFFFQFGSHSRKSAELLFAADPFQVGDVSNPVMLIEQSNALGSEPLNLKQFERRSRISLQHFIPPVERASLSDFAKDRCYAFTNTCYFGQFPVGVANDIFDALRVALHDRCRVAVTTDSKAVFAGNFH
jgi:hypothetical protein